ncbi:MAG: tetratricopeptide repeat protein [Candidatus Omnitrophica bacterium]|nr:tetratricopeptide repeat protein [Candidatus Omnitrophota bacterium]
MKPNYKTHTQASGKRLGPPVFAKFIVNGLFIVSLLAIFISHSNTHKIGISVPDLNTANELYRYNPSETKSYAKDAQSLHLQAKSLIRQKKYKEAETYAQKSLEAKSNFYRAYMDLGVIYTSYGDYIRAEKLFKKALEFVGNDTFDLEIIYADLGLIYLVERRFNDSWDYLRMSYERKNYLGDDFWDDKRLKYVPTNNKTGFIEQNENNTKLPREIRERRNRLDALLGVNNEEIVRNCEQYLKDNPGSVYDYVFRSLLASALYRRGEYEKSYEQLKIVESEKIPENYIPWVKLMYGYLYKQKGERQKAISYFRDVIVNYPDYEAAGQAKQMLLKLAD